MSNQAINADYLFIQPLLEARISAELQLPVEPIEQLAQLDTHPLRQDCAFVMWFGERFPDEARAGKSAQTAQQWLVVLGIQNVAQQDRAARNSAAGPHLARLHNVVAGWQPPGVFRPFKRINGPKPAYRANVGLYPLAFEILLNL